MGEKEKLFFGLVRGLIKGRKGKMAKPEVIRKAITMPITRKRRE